MEQATGESRRPVRAPRRAARGRDRLARLRRAGRRARRRLRRLRRRRAAGRPGAGRGDQGEAPLRRGAGGRAARAPAPTASPTAASTAASPAPARPGRACPTSASSPTSRSRSTTRCAGSAASTASSWRRSSRRSRQWRYRNKLEYSFGERRRGRADPRLPRARALGPDRRRRGLHARLRARQRGPQRGARLGAAGVDPAPTTGAREEGVLRNLVVREGRRTGQIQTRLVTSPAHFPKPPVDLHTAIEGPSGGTDGPTGVLGEERLREELCGLKLEMSHGAFFQTNTEMAERLYGVVAEYAGLSGSERVFDLYCGIGTIGLTMAGRRRRGLGAGDRPGGDRRRRGQRRAQRDRQRPLPRRQRPHRRATAGRGGRQARRRRHRPAPRGALAEDRAGG